MPAAVPASLARPQGRAKAARSTMMAKKFDKKYDDAFDDFRTSGRCCVSPAPARIVAATGALVEMRCCVRVFL